ncbi:MAG TPA: erythromycin esterase family protein [Gemmatimonadales bacterium]|nr:erythromycin esterase family protein [Gemmatimonadales bacterium]
MKKLRFSLLAMLCAGVPSTGSAQQPLNLDFERASTEGFTRPWNWTPFSYAPGGEAGLDSTVAHGGRRSLRISRPPGQAFPGAHAFATYLNPLAARGKTIRISGWIRSDRLAGRAYLTLQSWANFEVLAADTTEIASHGWSRDTLEIPVSSSIETIVVTANLEGTGTAWFDDLALEIDGRRVRELPVARAVESEEIDWLAHHSTVLRTVDAPKPGAAPDFSDLKPFGDIVGDARVVALGESTHGSSEFFRLKHRLVQYLVREHNFRLFAIEDQQLGMERVNAYVLGGPGTVEDAMRGMFGVWSTTEVRDLIVWMRSYNQQHGDDPVEFIGFDMQNPSLPIDSLLAFSRRFEPLLASTLEALLNDYREAWRKSSYPQYTAPESVHHRWADGAEAAWRLVEARRGAWLARAESPAESLSVEWAVQNARVIGQAGRFIFNNQPDRDSAMAANLAWRLELSGRDRRAIVWAHDSHISKGRATTAEGNYFVSSMGMYLDRRFGEAYRSFGILSSGGAYTAVRSMWGGPRNLAIISAFPAPRGSLEEIFHQVAQRLHSSLLLVNLAPALANPLGRLLLEDRPHRFVGYAAEDYGFSGMIQVGCQFDGILFVDQTSGTHPLNVTPWPPPSD